MRKFRIISIFSLFLLFNCESLQAESPSTIKPFTSDGCSAFPDGTLAQKELWLRCCVEHDKAYWQGGTKQQRLDSDLKLKQCVETVGKPQIAKLMLAGVRVGGSPYWPTKFRWGYGWEYPRAYGELTSAEEAQVQKAWKTYLSQTSSP